MVVVRLPPDPSSSRVSAYRVTVAIAQPPRQPFIPRPVDRPAPIVALAPIRDERELVLDYNRGGLLTEAGADNIRVVSDRSAIAPPVRMELASRRQGWTADALQASKLAPVAETMAASTNADTQVAVVRIEDAPSPSRSSFATDSLRPSDLDLWAEADPLEDVRPFPSGLVTADRGQSETISEDQAVPGFVIASDQFEVEPDAATLRDVRIADPGAPAADRLIRQAPGPILAEHNERRLTPDRFEAAEIGLNLAEATRPSPAQGDQWNIANTRFAANDAGLNRSDSPDRIVDDGAMPDLADPLILAATPADPMIGAPELGFDPEDAVFVTALLPDWSEWDDAVRRNALQERAMLRTATWSHGREAPEKLSATPASARNLIEMFDRHNFRLGGASVVPALFIKRLPADISSVPQAADRKALFLRALLPFVVATNERITRQRERLIDMLPLLEQGLPLGTDDRRFLESVQEEFRVSRPDPEELLRRMDVVPASLALAQAAEESGWGTSRPAREDNSLFGQMVFHEGGMRLREFDNLRETVESYIRNLNTHRAYADFRQKRAQLRRASRPLDSHALAGHIERYSERGTDYVATIRGLMTANGLRNFDDARLSDIEFLVQATAR